jgi:hypothetical protein
MMITQDKHTRGPAGYQEVGRGTLSFYDAEGDTRTEVRIAGQRKGTVAGEGSRDVAHLAGAQAANRGPQERNARQVA